MDLEKFDIHINRVEYKNEKVYYIILVEYNELKYEINKRYSEFEELNCELLHLGFSALPNLPKKKLMSYKNNEYINYRKRILNSYIQNLFIRPDIRCCAVFLNFLLFYDKINLSVDIVKTKLINNIGTQKFSLSDIYINEKYNFLICVYEDKSNLSKLGKLWSIIEPDMLGEIKIFSYNNDLTSTFVETYKEQTIYKARNIVCSEKNNQAIISGDDGKIYIYKINIESFTLTYIKNITCHLDTILKMMQFNNELFCTCGYDNAFRLLNLNDNYKILSGGRCNKRLDKDKITTCHLLSYNNIILGTDASLFFVYNMSTNPPIYIDTKKIKNGTKINCFTNTDKYLFVGYDNVIACYNYHYINESKSYKNVDNMENFKNIKNIKYDDNIKNGHTNMKPTKNYYDSYNMNENKFNVSTPYSDNINSDPSFYGNPSSTTYSSYNESQNVSNYDMNKYNHINENMHINKNDKQKKDNINNLHNNNNNNNNNLYCNDEEQIVISKVIVDNNISALYIPPLLYDNNVLSLCVNKEKKILYAGYEDAIIIWSITNGIIISSFHGHTNGVHFLKYLNKSEFLLSGGNGGNVKIWKNDLEQFKIWKPKKTYKLKDNKRSNCGLNKNKLYYHNNVNPENNFNFNDSDNTDKDAINSDHSDAMSINNLIEETNKKHEYDVYDTSSYKKNIINYNQSQKNDSYNDLKTNIFYDKKNENNYIIKDYKTDVTNLDVCELTNNMSNNEKQNKFSYFEEGLHYDDKYGYTYNRSHDNNDSQDNISYDNIKQNSIRYNNNSQDNISYDNIKQKSISYNNNSQDNISYDNIKQKSISYNNNSQENIPYNNPSSENVIYQNISNDNIFNEKTPYYYENTQSAKYTHESYSHKNSLSSIYENYSYESNIDKYSSYPKVSTENNIYMKKDTNDINYSYTTTDDVPYNNYKHDNIHNVNIKNIKDIHNNHVKNNIVYVSDEEDEDLISAFR
ncbi:phosphoinositide-binding protein, putative [Plasmodium sp. gorilla clade G2]|uniref:phosphoinositide-binding protein, putative n=1 Tax=Plasmodium sp. gorilla clade G2 TaxID=880535 RepID=UPI000D2012DE|nr:phosphoinositide-binding protein, putative [Plasmodium sp. gorilla clade G2]SOV12797.1 phosphoinositide-binding protein, putative [Plasmodium sp. gorilla clade G2]